MTLGELKERISHYGDRYDDLEVCIPNNKGGMGGMSVTSVKQAARGIDWDSGKFIIWPETEMKERTKDDIIDKEKLREEAKKHAELYNKLFPPKHPNLSDEELDRLKDVALGSHYTGYIQGYENAKNK